jgi:hypothetical protein
MALARKSEVMLSNAEGVENDKVRKLLEKRGEIILVV